MVISTQTLGTAKVLDVLCAMTHREIPEIRREVSEEVTKEDCSRLVLNLVKVANIDSSGIGFVVALWKEMRAADCQVIISGMSKTVENAFRSAQIHALIPSVPSTEDALKFSE